MSASLWLRLLFNIFLICSQVYLDKYILCVFKLNQNDSEVWMSQENLINFLHLIRVQFLELGQTHIHMYSHTERFKRKKKNKERKFRLTQIGYMQGKYCKETIIRWINN